MTFSEFFVCRPRFAGVVAIVMILLGLIALAILPISQYPEITPPQIVVKATYPGANAQLLVDTVGIPIENQINGVEGMMYMSSTATDNGQYQLTITFNVGVDADIAQVKVENRLEQAKALLPSIVIQEGVEVRSQSANLLAFLVLESPNGTQDTLSLSNYAYANIQNPLKRIDGVSDVNIFGPQKSMRIWLNPRALAAMNLSANTVVKAIESQNAQSAIGTLGAAPSGNESTMVLSLTTMGLLSTKEEFENIVVVAGKDGSVVRLKDVARVEFGADNYQLDAQYNGRGAVVMEVNQMPNSNALKIIKNLHEVIDELKQSFPPDMVLKVAYDSTAFVHASIENIVETLFLTFFLVVLVVYIFLQSWRSTLIPMITIPVSLIATFSVLYVIGFDLNILTLFAMVLAIGLVVDDAIIVVERVEYLMEYNKMGAVAASIQAMKDISSSIIATTLVLLSIFVPVAMMAGITGKIYQQFAVTISTAVIFSSVNALTLSPALCALLLQRKNKKDMKFNWFDRGFTFVAQLYLKCVHVLVDHLRITGVICGIIVVVLGILFGYMPTSFIPEEDQGFILANVQLSDTAPIHQTKYVLEKMADKVIKTDGVEYMIGIAGTSMLSAGGENIGMAAIGLMPWSQRKNKALSVQNITKKLSEYFEDCQIANIEFFEMPAIPGVGTSGGLSFQLNAVRADVTAKELYEAQEKLLWMMNQDRAFNYAFGTFTAETPHVYLDIDRTKLESYGVSVNTLFNTLQNNFGSRYVNNITLDGQTNKVIVAAESNYRQTPQDVGALFVLNALGARMPIQEFVSISTTVSPKIIYRFNQYLSAAITAGTAKDVSSGTAIKRVKDFVHQLENQFGISWTGLTLQEVKTQGLVYILITLAIIFSYLFLVALYESWCIPLSVMATNIFAVLGALIGLKMMAQSLSIYAQLGIILLIGLASKNAILIVQFILDAIKSGANKKDAAILGAKERYRAVLMTAFTFILGVFPMVIATGAGAASQISMGSAVFFGMIVATIVGVVFVPALFLLFDFEMGDQDASMENHG